MKKIIFSLGIFALGSLTTLATVNALMKPIGFPDVDYSSYYSKALSNMVGKKVINGYANGNFGPNDAVTRAQLVTILDRYDAEVNNMRVVVCNGVKKEQVNKDFQPNYDTLCPLGQN